MAWRNTAHTFLERVGVYTTPGYNARTVEETARGSGLKCGLLLSLSLFFLSSSLGVPFSVGPHTGRRANNQRGGRACGPLVSCYVAVSSLLPSLRRGICLSPSFPRCAFPGRLRPLLLFLFLSAGWRARDVWETAYRDAESRCVGESAQGEREQKKKVGREVSRDSFCSPTLSSLLQARSQRPAWASLCNPYNRMQARVLFLFSPFSRIPIFPIPPTHRPSFNSIYTRRAVLALAPPAAFSL